MLLHSAELRWFWRGQPSPGVVDWFQSGRRRPTEARVDRYLVLPGCESVGVKERDGRFEIKARRGGSEPVALAGAATGRAECWVKWSYGEPAVEAWIDALRLDPAGWVEVRKQRRLRKLAVGEQLQEVDSGARLASGCTIELTELSCCGFEWWSFGFEAFGDALMVRTHLESVARDVLAASSPPVPLDVTHSCSYPTWLAACGGRAEQDA